MGAAWRNVKTALNLTKYWMVRTINKLEMEVCCTLGMITETKRND
jgi:biotin synthase